MLKPPKHRKSAVFVGFIERIKSFKNNKQMKIYITHLGKYNQKGKRALNKGGENAQKTTFQKGKTSLFWRVGKLEIIKIVIVLILIF